MKLMQDESPERLVCVQVTYADAKQARQVAKEIVEKRLGACVQQVRISSTYVWEGAVEEEAEHLLTIKTTMQRARDLEDYIHANHPYDEPEFLVIPAVAASNGYATWVRKSVR
ncbi:divalent-cation tolerance protein CutA [Ahrensia marina]|uniref:divalent-cation tolerance protein CutA n=1 Tax=Ahrensia marina TaxID=1514904 RepID=UPI0035CF86E8